MDQLRIMTVCTGNICRSPMAEVVLRERLADAGLAGRVVVDSTGTTGYEVGEPMDPRARRVLLAAGYSDPGIGGHRARQVSASDLRSRDLVLAATHDHVRALRRVLGVGADDDAAAHVRLIRSFDSASGPVDLADPWYGDLPDFEQCLAEIEASVDGILTHLPHLTATHPPAK